MLKFQGGNHKTITIKLCAVSSESTEFANSAIVVFGTSQVKMLTLEIHLKDTFLLSVL